VTRRTQVFLSIAVFGALLAGKVIYESRKEWREAGIRLSSGETEEGIRHFERSIHWYLPGNPFVLRSVRELWRIGQEEEKRNPSRALLAYDGLRGSLHSIRSFYWPHREWILKADDRIAELRAREEASRRPDVPYETILRKHQALLVPVERPRVGWVILAQIGFWGWIVSVVGWIRKGFDEEGRMNVRRSLPWILSLVLLFAAWLIGLTRA
jgi:hypothetical protein